MMRLQRRQETAQHAHRGLFRRLAHLHDLKATRQRSIALKISLVFRPRGGRDRSQLAARERRLEQISSIALAGNIAGTDQGMRLIDKEDDGTRRVRDVLDHALEPALELAFHSSTCLQEAKIQCMNFDTAQRYR